MSRSFVVVGDETLTVECLKLLLDTEHSVELVISRSPHVARWAEERSVSHREAIQGPLPPCDYVLSSANLRMLPRRFLDAPRIAAINFHDGPLPRYAGLNAPVWALLEGATTYGVTWHLMTAEPDAGDILEQDLFDLDSEETALSLNTRCFEAGLAAFRRLLPRLESGQLNPVGQDLSERTYYELGKPLPSGGVIDPREGVEAVCRLVRALDFGSYANPVGSAWLAGPSGAMRVANAEIGADGLVRDIGRISAEGMSLWLECSNGVVVLSALTTANGESVTPEQALEILGVRQGGNMPNATSSWFGEAAEFSGAASASERRYTAAMTFLAPDLPFLRNDSGTASIVEMHSDLEFASPNSLVAALGRFVASLTSSKSRIWVASGERARRTAGHSFLFDEFVPVQFNPDERADVSLNRAHEALVGGPLSRDVAARQQRRIHPGGDRLAIDFSGERLTGPFELILACAPGQQPSWRYDAKRFRREDVAAFDEAFAAYLTHFPAAESDLLSPSQLDQLSRWNATSVDFDRDETIVSAFEWRATERPNAIALVDGRRSLTYGELNSRANALARRLAELGAGPDELVAVHMDRSLDLVVALLGVLKSGAAYVPVDPAYPDARKSLMVEDSGASLVISSSPIDVPTAVRIVGIDDRAGSDGTTVPLRARAENLAYVIYTSGSTGRPKGVMLEHRNVVNFFHGMDDRIGKDPGTWLAVTSISFDISVLELLWTLTRGFTVVLHGAKERQESTVPALSVFFFGSDAGSASYQLLLDAARYADANGFEAVWTPERHFHAFGGAFPNPSVTSAALAAATTKIAIRAGSCVLPLHSAVRVAEEWALVDQISRGRVGVSFATGWQPNDFVINPAGYGSGKTELLADIHKVQALWRGETLEFPGHDGAPVSISTLPRPVQPELPAWLTSAGDPESFRVAGEQGLNLLTHLLGQSMEELARKITIYREAWKRAGHTGEGRVTLMLHSYVSESDDDARETVREPMIAYLRSSVGLIRQFATSFPTFKNTLASDGDLLQSLAPEELRELLEVAFERYYETSGLFGDSARAGETLRAAKRIGVDELACLIDFGVSHELVMRSLERISALLKSSGASEGAEFIPELIDHYSVTHFQCTPSMAGMLVSDPEFRRASQSLQMMMVGGEAFPVDLANQLKALVGGRLLNMYGPTETTIWSTTCEVEADSKSVSIGTPIANTSIYILGPDLQMLPPGAVGELWIGGEGVARGYLGRPDLTAERFVAVRSSPISGSRMYRTGDLARLEQSGTLTFLGRVDQQVKVRGYRIEPGEIETIIRAEPGVTDAVVIAREDSPGDQRLVCYYVSTTIVDELRLRDTVRTQLPAYMVPTNFMRLDALPLTPNKKVDRKTLPRPGITAEDACQMVETAATKGASPELVATGAAAPEVLRLVVDSWTDVLRTPDLPRNRTFFDCGGNSLLLLQLHKRLLPHHPSLKLTDLFRHPTIDSLASYLGNNPDSTSSVDDVSRRALARRSALGRRPVHA